MRMKGLEPSRLAALGPKPSASANSATSALINQYTINKYQAEDNFGMLWGYCYFLPYLLLR